MESGLVEAMPQDPGTEATGEQVDRIVGGFPELTALGKRIEMLRIERGLSKQALARGAATSRQQLWRVMTGKSELTSTLGHRLAEVLQIDSRVLRGHDAASAVQTWSAGGTGSLSVAPAVPPVDAAPASFAEFVADAAHLERALASIPSDADGMRLRRGLLDAVHEIATAAGIPLGPAWFTLRAAVTTV